MTRPFHCRCDDGNLYFVKGRAASQRSLICEWLGGNLAKAFGLPIPEFTIAQAAPELLELHPEGRDLGSMPLFASRKDDSMAPSLMNPVPCQYAIIRFLPYAETGEFANVGVALACPATGYFDFRLVPTRKTGRIRGFFEQLDLKIYRDALTYMGEELERLRALAANVAIGNKEAVRQLFIGLVHPRETLLRFGETRVVMAEDPDAMLGQLFARMVERDFANKDYHDKLVERGVRELLRKANLRMYFNEAVIGNEDLHLNVPFAHKRGENVHLAIKPLDLAKDEASRVFDTGGRLVDRIQRLKKHNLLPPDMLVAVQRPDGNDQRILGAIDEIEGDLRKAGVEVERADNIRAITAFAKAAALH